MSDFCRRTLLLSVLSVALITGIRGQEPPGQALPNLIRGNERFGRTLLEHVHRRAPDRNVVVSPISVSIILAALQSSSEYGEIRKEVGKAFGWGENPNLDVPSRMLLVAFEKPDPPRTQTPKVDPRFRELPEAAWISNAVVYRGHGTLSERFISAAEKYYGMTFSSTGPATPTQADIRRSRESAGALPSTNPLNDVVISSGTHLRTAWSGNTFALSKPYQGEFETASGQPKLVKMLTSEATTYRYAKTERFEAVVLPCNRAYMLAVLPAPGQSILDLERELAASPVAIDAALKPHAGTVAMPPFHIQVETDLRQQIEEIGVRQVFKDLGSIVKIPASRLTEIRQKVDIQVDGIGIRADAETVGGAIYGGVAFVADPFRMEINRPFLFLIRDQTTDALLFLGAVVDPSLN